MPEDTVVNALVGALVAVALVFLTPVVSVVVGGGVAGYLQKESGGRVGALTGVFAAVPFVLLFVVVGSFIALGPLGSDAGAFSVFGLMLLLVGLVVVGGVAAGLGALGGYLGVYVASEM